MKWIIEVETESDKELTRLWETMSGFKNAMVSLVTEEVKKPVVKRNKADVPKPVIKRARKPNAPQIVPQLEVAKNE